MGRGAFGFFDRRVFVIDIDIPGRDLLRLHQAVCDYNGAIVRE